MQKSNEIIVSCLAYFSGHQRVRAAKELGMTLVPIKIDEDLQDEDSKLRALISNNFGRRKNNPDKDRKAIDTYVRLRGYKQGRPQKQSTMDSLSLDDIAKELKISKTNLKRALRIERNLTDSMKELLDDGTISKTLASDTIASLSKEEQEQLISSLDITKGITQREKMVASKWTQRTIITIVIVLQILESKLQKCLVCTVCTSVRYCI